MSRSGKPVDVSVIIPTYNRAGLVVEAIESVLRQTAPPREIIVVDDGSTDGTPDALASFGDRIVAVRQENQGVGGARNRALAMASGRYLAFLDSDDVWLDFKLELQVDVLERNPALGFLFSDFQIKGEGGTITPNGLQTWYRHPLRWEDVLDDLVTTSVLRPIWKGPVRIHSGRMYRALLAEPYVLPSSAILRAGCLNPDVRFGENGPNCTDWEFFARLARICTAGFIELDTVINRGGNDRPRLTQTSAATKAQLRLHMIDAVWKADADFLLAHGEEVIAVEADQCLELARAHALDSKGFAAFAALRRWLRLGHLARWKLALALAGCALVPGSGAVLRGIRRLLEGKGSVVTAEPRTAQTESRSG